MKIPFSKDNVVSIEILHSDYPRIKLYFESNTFAKNAQEKTERYMRAALIIERIKHNFKTTSSGNVFEIIGNLDEAWKTLVTVGCLSKSVHKYILDLLRDDDEIEIKKIWESSKLISFEKEHRKEAEIEAAIDILSIACQECTKEDRERLREVISKLQIELSKDKADAELSHNPKNPPALGIK